MKKIKKIPAKKKPIKKIDNFNELNQKEFMKPNNEKLTLETRNSFYLYRRIIIHYKDAKHKKTPTHISEGWCFLL